MKTTKFFLHSPRLFPALNLIGYCMCEVDYRYLLFFISLFLSYLYLAVLTLEKLTSSYGSKPKCRSTLTGNNFLKSHFRLLSSRYIKVISYMTLNLFEMLINLIIGYV